MLLCQAVQCPVFFSSSVFMMIFDIIAKNRAFGYTIPCHLCLSVSIFQNKKRG